MPKELDSNGGLWQQGGDNDSLSSSTGSGANNTSKEIKTEEFSSTTPTIQSKGSKRPLSPYPNV